MAYKLGKNDCVILDFDDTIWMWDRNRIIYKAESSLMHRMTKGTYYKPEFGFVPEFVDDFIEECIIHRVSVKILSVCESSYEYMDKLSFLTDRYGLHQSDIITVSNNDLKADVIKGLMTTMKCTTNWHFIDDRVSVLYNCGKEIPNLYIHIPIFMGRKDYFEFE